MTEQDKERRIAKLESVFAGRIHSRAGGAFRRAMEQDALDIDEAHDAAHDAVFNALIDDAAWENVEAVDISDIATEAAYEAEREYREDMSRD